MFLLLKNLLDFLHDWRTPFPAEVLDDLAFEVIKVQTELLGHCRITLQEAV